MADVLAPFGALLKRLRDMGDGTHAEVVYAAGAGGGGGGGGDASAANQATQITRETEIRDRLPASIGPQAAAASLAVTLASDGPLVTAVGQPGDAAATSDTGSFGVLAFIKRTLQNWTTLLSRVPSPVSGRIPTEVRHQQVTGEAVSIAGLAAGVTAYGSVINLGSNRGQTMVTAMKSKGFSQADLLFIEQSDDQTFATGVHYCPRGDGSVGALFSWSNASGGNTAVTACPSMQYARAGITCMSGGSAQPAGSNLVIGVLPGGL